MAMAFKSWPLPSKGGRPDLENRCARSCVADIDTSEIHYELCGTYRISGSADALPRAGQHYNQSWVLAGIVRNATALCQELALTSDTLEALIEFAAIPRTPTELIDSILLWL